MIDTWFKKDINKVYATHNIVVFVDASNQAKFLLDSLEDSVHLLTANNEIEELKIKYEIEKQVINGNTYLIYTTTPKDKLKFVREYCETNGCIEIKYLDHYIKQKVNQHLNLNINLSREELISAAKVSVGKDQTYWMDLSHKGSSEIFDLEKELLPFLDDPASFVKKFDKETQTIFYKKVTELIGQTYLKKPAKTLATEVVNFMFDGLTHHNISSLLLNVYKTWLDSLSYQKSLWQYVEKYKLEYDGNVFEVHPAHPFDKIDKQWLQEIANKIDDKNYINRVLPKINQRIASITQFRLGITFWSDVKVLLEFDEKNINQISNLEEATNFYLNHHYKLDRAIRKLYTQFLSEKELMEPIQAYYKNIVSIYLDKWFRYIGDYKENQKGTIQEILDTHSTKTAIVVGDGVSWEFAHDIISAMGKHDYDFTKKHLCAGLPSETEHNMSQLYVDTGEVLATKKEREQYLVNNNTDKELDFIDLENVNEATDSANYLICSYKDPDKLGETYQQKALRYFDQVAQTFADKIQQLLKNGYKQVYLVTDHGYTLTGILENSDKIEVAFEGKVNKSERFIRTKRQQQIDTGLLVEKQILYKEFEYCYFAKRLGPFKTPGVYGFSHGGLSPQETLIPLFKWTNNSKKEEVLDVKITNKADLKEITGNLYSVKLKGNSASGDLFNSNRKIILVFYAKGVEVSKSDVFSIENGQELKKEFQFDSNTSIDIKVLDAQTKEQLDKSIVTQSTARDMGGLL